jgi:hypothetical protein
LPAPHCHVWIFRTISGSQMGSQLLQNVQIIKQTDYFGKSEENMDLSRIYLAVRNLFSQQKVNIKKLTADVSLKKYW